MQGAYGALSNSIRTASAKATTNTKDKGKIDIMFSSLLDDFAHYDDIYPGVLLINTLQVNKRSDF